MGFIKSIFFGFITGILTWSVFVSIKSYGETTDKEMSLVPFFIIFCIILFLIIRYGIKLIPKSDERTIQKKNIKSNKERTIQEKYNMTNSFINWTICQKLSVVVLTGALASVNYRGEIVMDTEEFLKVVIGDVRDTLDANVHPGATREDAEWMLKQCFKDGFIDLKKDLIGALGGKIFIENVAPDWMK